MRKDEQQRQEPKGQYRVKNWPAYNAGLIARGDVTIWIERDLWQRGAEAVKRGRPRVYADAVIQMLLGLKQVFRLPLRAAGFRREHEQACLRRSAGAQLHDAVSPRPGSRRRAADPAQRRTVASRGRQHRPDLVATITSCSGGRATSSCASCTALAAGRSHSCWQRSWCTDRRGRPCLDCRQSFSAWAATKLASSIMGSGSMPWLALSAVALVTLAAGAQYLERTEDAAEIGVKHLPCCKYTNTFTNVVNKCK
ncbi:Transposase DDE domain-containing protein [Rugamonas rubra]|uniref:Transposase DDE domain-containing protein n=1 Tax=Rugamonas rubra TaxID=758825 RepID=A0A1I4R923_9BURK|nr:Transposase DDE domain-containing protein [Rugamonas rubra]